MKKIMLIAATLLSMTATWAGGKEDINVMTFNIRTDTGKDGDNGWEFRRDRAANAVKFYDADLVGMQEVRHNQLEDFIERLPGYSYVGVGRKDGKTGGEYCPVWYRTDRFTRLDSGNFWLSETPDVPGSKGWDTSYERIASWVKLKDNNTGKTFVFMNTHLDHKGPIARKEGARLLLTKIAEIAGNLPVMLTGDFNAVETDEPIQVILNSGDGLALTDSHKVSKLVYGPNWTWHNFGRTPLERRTLIDYVFIKGPVTVNRYGVLAETEGTAFLSDHAPILVNLSIK